MPRSSTPRVGNTFLGTSAVFSSRASRGSVFSRDRWRAQRRAILSGEPWSLSRCRAPSTASGVSSNRSSAPVLPSSCGTQPFTGLHSSARPGQCHRRTTSESSVVLSARAGRRRVEALELADRPLFRRPRFNRSSAGARVKRSSAPRRVPRSTRATEPVGTVASTTDGPCSQFQLRPAQRRGNVKVRRACRGRKKPSGAASWDPS